MLFKRFAEEQKAALRKEGLVTEKSTDEYSKILYVVPLPKDKIIKVGVKQSPAHIGNLCNSIDFAVPEGTEIYAAADGIVIDVKDDSNVNGRDIKYWNEGNYIIIKHNDEFTQYEHLKFKGVLVKVGEIVKQGQTIGYSGNTGYSGGPHLHFECQRYLKSDDNNYVTLKARFKDFRDVYV